MKYYELTYLISPDQTEKDLSSLEQKTVSFLQKNGGLINETKGPIKKILGCPVKKKGVVFEVTLNFCLAPDKLLDFEKNLQSEPEILRYLILKKAEPGKEVASETPPSLRRLPGKTWESKKIRTAGEWHPKKEAFVSRAFDRTQPKPSSRGKPKVELEEIEKKLEEIIGE